MYRIRIDQNDLQILNVADFTDYESYVLVHHVLPHGNPHFHLYVDTGGTKEQTLRQRIKRHFYNHKSSDYSIKKCDPDRIDEYVQYMFNTKHGNVAKLISKFNFDDDRLNICMENARKVSDDFSEQKKSSKPTIYDLAMEVKTIMLSRYPTGYQTLLDPNEYRQPPEGYEEYAEHLEIAIDVCRKHRQPFEEHYLRRLVSTAICERSTGRRTIVSKILAKEFPDR